MMGFQGPRLYCRLNWAAANPLLSVTTKLCARHSLSSGSWSPTLPQAQAEGILLLSLRHRQQSDGALVISRLSAEDGGFFTCTASNGRDQDQRQVLLRPLGTRRVAAWAVNYELPSDWWKLVVHSNVCWIRPVRECVALSPC